jgi:hypothetical protein
MEITNLALFVHDWHEIFTAEQAEEELEDFEFKGPGWYHSCGDTLLVLPYRCGCSTENDAEFHFYVWSDINPIEAFKQIATLSVHSKQV